MECLNCGADLVGIKKFCGKCGKEQPFESVESAPGLIEKINSKVAKAVNQSLPPGEKIHVQLSGVFKEALICTDRRVMIVKTGFMTGTTFGSNIFQLAYSNVTGVEVKIGLMSGYFEISSGGVQNTPKNYWAQGTASPERSPNCVSLTRARNIAGFRQACAFILEKAEQARMAPAQTTVMPQSAGDSDLAALERLAALREKGALTDAEFQTKKAEILARL